MIYFASDIKISHLFRLRALRSLTGIPAHQHDAGAFGLPAAGNGIGAVSVAARCCSRGAERLFSLREERRVPPPVHLPKQNSPAADDAICGFPEMGFLMKMGKAGTGDSAPA